METLTSHARQVCAVLVGAAAAMVTVADAAVILALAFECIARSSGQKTVTAVSLLHALCGREQRPVEEAVVLLTFAEPLPS